jgi:ParB-like chromosome segregation protein Spo0J
LGAGLIMPRKSHTEVPMGFEKATRRLAIADLQPLKIVSAAIKKSPKYVQIVASIGEIGIVEPPVVTPDRKDKGKYLLLDGHLRIEALKDRGETEVVCLISIDDEAFTYNKRVNRIAVIQEHRMIMKAIERGVSEERLAKALSVDAGSIKRKRRLLEGICGEVANILKDKHIAIQALAELRKLAPLRQIEATELMVAMNKYTFGYAKSLVAATPQDQLAEGYKPKRVRGLTSEQVALMERETANLDREFRIAEQSYGTDHLDLVIASGYIGKLLGNAKVVRYLGMHQKEILLEFQKLVELEAAAA